MKSDAVLEAFDALIDAVAVQVAGSEDSLCDHMRRRCDRIMEAAKVELYVGVEEKEGRIYLSFAVEDEVTTAKSVDLEDLFAVDAIGASIEDLQRYAMVFERLSAAARRLMDSAQLCAKQW